MVERVFEDDDSQQKKNKTSQKEVRRKPSDWRATSSRDDLLSHMLLEQLTAIIGLVVTRSCVQVHVNQPCSFCTEGIQLEDFLCIALDWIASQSCEERGENSLKHQIRVQRKQTDTLDARLY